MNLSSEKGFRRTKCANQTKQTSTSTRIFSTRAQKDASSAANLIALLGLFMIMYILFVPPAEREALLDDPPVEDPDTPHVGRLVKTLIDEEPGELVRSPAEDFEYSLPSFTLRESTYSEVLLSENPFVVRRSWFSDSAKELEFSVPSVKDTVRLLLTFEVGSRPRGDLEILLNGYRIYHGLPDEGPMDPIEIPRDKLRDKNRLTLRSSLPGLMFWSATEFRIRGLKLAGDFYDPADLESSHTFFISEQELDVLESARMTFSPSCDRDKVGRLSINVNGQSIFSSIPDCNTLNRVSFNPDILEEENEIAFISTGGDYTISLGKVTGRLGEMEAPRYAFELSESEYRSLMSRSKSLKVSMGLQDDDRFKEAYVLVNSVRYFLNTRDGSFEQVVDPEVLRKGRNVIEIKPLNSFEAVSLKAGLYRD